MIVIGKHINGITLNPLEYVLEYVLEYTGEVKEFETEQDAKDFLIRQGLSKEDIETFIYKEVNHDKE